MNVLHTNANGSKLKNTLTFGLLSVCFKALYMPYIVVIVDTIDTKIITIQTQLISYQKGKPKSPNVILLGCVNFFAH